MGEGGDDRVGRGAPVLVLALGNTLLGDGGVGPAILADVRGACCAFGEAVELLDGGTHGMSLLGRITGRRAVLILDAIALGAPSGTIHVLQGEEVIAARPTGPAIGPESNAAELLRAVRLLRELPPDLILLGIEPERFEAGAPLSYAVRKSLASASRRALDLIGSLVDRSGVRLCTNSD